jgi:transketolase
VRKQFVETLEELMASDEKLIVLLGDIGVFGFRNVFQNHPTRIYNMGICEQSMTSMAAGLAKEGLHPIVHSIAPFVVERCFEQLKDDVGYQKLPINVISVGASYDYAALGCTHHCPGDVSLMKTIPGMNVIVPGSDKDFDELFRQVYAGPNPNYIRLTEKGHSVDVPVRFGRGTKIREGKDGVVIAVGPMLERVINACADLDVTVLYYTTVSPFDSELLFATATQGKVFVVEPFYEGTMAFDIVSSVKGRSTSVLSIGVPRRFLTSYGSASDQDRLSGLDGASIKMRIEEFLRA